MLVSDHFCYNVCVWACMYACMHACIYVCMHVCMHACMYVCLHVFKLRLWWLFCACWCLLLFVDGYHCSGCYGNKRMSECWRVVKTHSWPFNLVSEPENFKARLVNAGSGTVHLWGRKENDNEREREERKTKIRKNEAESTTWNTPNTTTHSYIHWFKQSINQSINQLIN